MARGDRGDPPTLRGAPAVGPAGGTVAGNGPPSGRRSLEDRTLAIGRRARATGPEENGDPEAEGPEQKAKGISEIVAERPDGFDSLLPGRLGAGLDGDTDRSDRFDSDLAGDAEQGVPMVHRGSSGSGDGKNGNGGAVPDDVGDAGSATPDRSVLPARGGAAKDRGVL